MIKMVWLRRYIPLLSLVYNTLLHELQVFFAELAVELERRGMTVSQYLTSLYGKYVLSIRLPSCCRLNQSLDMAILRYVSSDKQENWIHVFFSDTK